MPRPKKESLRVLFTKAVNMLEANAPLETIYPILRDTTPEVAKLYNKHPGAQIRLVYEADFDGWHLWTTIPSLDYTHEARWKCNEALPSEEDAELRSHLTFALNSWLDEDALFSEPMSKMDVAAKLDIDVRTLWTMIANGDIRVIEINKNVVRVLKTHLPQK